ncbi:histidine kinase [Algoriphagus sp. A40]|uniref:histidine kinase n=1 Tax=Algoriphagus sp. A40 TaxID=1945863 RepID=UPI000985EED5|nr:histidine kinase [Algoriphagus sp. A40]OOG75206.1 hypothetical protein B0E43_09410 [Algoriphagus sp. A40]
MTPFPDIKPIYRLLLPLLVGILAYLAILLAFDTVERMMEDFFTREMLFCVVVSIVLLEANRGLLLAFKKKLVYSRDFGKYAATLIVLSVITCIFLVSSFLIGYFSWFENMTEVAVYTTELKIFNGIFLFVTLLFQSHFLGFYLIHKRFERELEKEAREKETLDRNVNLFHYQLNPNFLLTCLDSILLRLGEKQFDQADEGILLLSEIYRYSLNTQEELVSLEEELNAMKTKAAYLNQFNSRNIDIQNPVIKGEYLLVPRTLTKLLEAIAYSQLSSSSSPLKIAVESHLDQLILSFPCNFSLVSEDQLYRTLKEVQEQYVWLNKEMKWTVNGTFFIYISLEKPFHPSSEKSLNPLFSTTTNQA